MSRAFQYDVFLSYSFKDTKIVHALAERLRRDGLSVWLDAWEIQPGDLIPLKFQAGLEQSRTLLMCMSPAYFESEWGTLEHHTLLFRDPTNAQRRFIPFLIEDCTPPDIIAQFAYIDWRTPSDEAYGKLLATVWRVEPGQAKPVAGEEPVDKARMVLKGHTETVFCVAIMPDGKTVVSGSADNTLKVWDLETGQCRATFKGHTDEVVDVAVTPDGKTVVSGSADYTLKVWDLETSKCRATFEGHTGCITGLAVTPDGKTVVSGSADYTLKVWDLETSQCRATYAGFISLVECLAITPDSRMIMIGTGHGMIYGWDLETSKVHANLRGHIGSVKCLVVTSDGKTVVSGSDDKTLKVWDLATGCYRATFEGHNEEISDVAFTPDGKTVVSGSWDRTLRVFDLATGQCRATFEGHTDKVLNVATTPDGKTVISVSRDKTLRVWDLTQPETIVKAIDVARYINAKVVLVGESGVGKTGLALRLCEDRWEVTESTHGMIISRLELPPGSGPNGMEREVWLWDFAGQPDYRLIHQLYMDETALGVLVFDPQDDNPFEEIGYWEKALCAATKHQPAKLLVAARCDRGGITISGKHFKKYVQEQGFAGFLSTEAKTGHGCEELKEAIARNIPWKQLPWTATRQLFKTLKDAIIKLIEEGKSPVHMGELRKRSQLSFQKDTSKELIQNLTFNEADIRAVLAQLEVEGDVEVIGFDKILSLKPESIRSYAPVVVRLPELRQRLQLLLPKETITEADLRAVVGLMQSQGVVLLLSFGDFLLLRPEWINRYASVVVRMAREHADEMGVVPEHQVLDGRLDYKDMERLSEADEKILLRAIVQTFLDRSLCIRQDTPRGTMLVFPSYFRRDNPEPPGHPNVFVTYSFAGPLDEIYATLVVRLSYSDGFKTDQFWKDAADFMTPAGRRVGLAMTKKAEGAAQIVVYFESGVPDDTKVTFIKYVHEHLLARAHPRESVTRVRTYVCPTCDETLENRRAIQIRLSKGLKDIVCPVCENRVPLLDLIEEKFASDEFLRRVREMDERARINLDNESRELILVGHAYAVTGEAGQIYRQYTNSDHGIDGEIEFKNDKGEASGHRLYLQLKSGDSYLQHRQRDDVEVFAIKKKRWVEYWLSQAYPVMLVIRTSDGKIRWMNVTDYLQQHGEDAKQIIFEGEPFTAPNVAKLRDKILF